MVDFNKINLINKTVSFTGHRPKKLGGCYSLLHPTSQKISDALYSVIKDLVDEKSIIKFISGGAIGFDQISFWTVEKLKKTYPDLINSVAIPFKNQASKWTDPESQEWYVNMLNKADEIVYVDEIDKYSFKGVPIGDYHVAKLQKRNEYMADFGKHSVSCWDRSSGGTKNFIDYALKNRNKIINLNPKLDFKVEKIN